MRTTVFIRRRSTDDFASVDGSALLGIAIVGLLLVAILLSAQFKYVLRSIKRSSAVYLMLFCFVAIISSVWSEAPDYSLFRATEILAVMVTAFILMSRYNNIIDADTAMLRFLLLAALLSLSQRVLSAGFSIHTLHTNTYTVIAGMGFLYAYGESLVSAGVVRKKLRRWAFIMFLLLAVGTSVGSNISAFIGFLVMIAFAPVSRRYLVGVAIMVFIIAILWVSGLLEYLLFKTIFAGRSVEKLASLTGRGYLWEGYFSGIQERPIQGYGFAVGARLGHLFGINSTTNTHNGFLDAAVGTGMLGLSFLLFWLVRHVRDLSYLKKIGCPGCIGMIGASVMVIVNNNSKTIIGGGFDPTYAAAMILFAHFHFSVLVPVLNRKELDRASGGGYKENALQNVVKTEKQRNNLLEKAQRNNLLEKTHNSRAARR